jgi:hypothetical protein
VENPKTIRCLLVHGTAKNGRIRAMRIKRNVGWIVLPAIIIAGVLAPCVVLAQLQPPKLLQNDLTLNIVYDGFNSMKAGEERTLFLEVGNAGDNALTDIRLSADAPEGWTVSFSPNEIDSLAPGSFQTVDVMLKSADNTQRGDYNIAVIARAAETQRVTSIYTRVESSSLFWVWVAAGMGAVLIAGFVIIFLRFGRE